MSLLKLCHTCDIGGSIGVKVKMIRTQLFHKISDSEIHPECVTATGGYIYQILVFALHGLQDWISASRVPKCIVMVFQNQMQITVVFLQRCVKLDSCAAVKFDNKIYQQTHPQ